MMMAQSRGKVSNLIHNDCINVKLNEISLIYLDPPYSFKQEDNYYGVGSSLEEYLSFIKDRLIVLKSCMSDNSNILIHLDFKTSHYVKVLADSIFGRDNFRNEIVWAYSSPSVAKSHLPRKHDIILWYGIGAYPFNQEYIPYSGKLNVGGKTGWNDSKDTTEYKAW